MTFSNYQHIVLKGLPYDRGYTHGEQAKQKILDSLAHYHKPGKLLPWDISQRIIKEVYLPGIEKYFPEALPELRGIANGAGVDLDQILFLNARSAANTSQAANGHVAQNGFRNIASSDEPTDIQELQECTTAGFLAESMDNGDVMLAQNWDMSANVFLKDTAVYLEIHPDPSEDLPVMFVTTEAGQLGRSGFNSAGLGRTTTTIADVSCEKAISAQY
ncbi:acyl-coenzyme A:6-aminopenicillanic-acid-acyltransferase 40 kDa form [Trichoderma asperellum]|uniref:Acyl-coenzyme A:6-aminopenicillanic-acid-acyltransferase 40 kDa form n=1 Tax=Trichoderma asperellum TaxID=101201 RepID=A0A6V8QIF5_TRIAP|nr:acyl-coenzyme A:6-aminopenicillanic-acid-acyltransferase 40 kDa form [Trichoderma asperellum]